ncbi:MAG: substrate-binding domain-containing protein [Chloroflexi bacterium]|nr:substrate-binding domain-containing protein [Chloroflexota bacterium]
MASRQAIGFIAPSLAGEFMTGVMEGILQSLRKHHYDLIAVQGAPQHLINNQLAKQHIKAWIVIIDPTGLNELATNVPAVVISAPHAGERFPLVMPDNNQSARAMVEHLIEHGHSKIAFVGNFNNSDMRDRYTVYCDVLKEHRITPNPAWVVDVGDYTEGRTEHAFYPLIANGLNFSAVVAANDQQAVGVMMALETKGYRVPHDMAVVGFDDANIAQHANPPLTTVRQQPQLLGSIAADTVIELIAGKSVSNDPIYVPTIPIWRQSCGCKDVYTGINTSTVAPKQQHWADQLAQRMQQVLYYPVPIDPNLSLNESNQGIRSLIQALQAKIEVQTVEVDYLAAWHAIITVSSKSDTLSVLYQVFAAAAHQELAQADLPADQISGLLATAHTSLLHTVLELQRNEITGLDRLLAANHELSMLLVSNQKQQTGKLAWMQRLPVSIACLALWDEQKPGFLRLASIYSKDGSSTIKAGSHCRGSEFPPAEFLEQARQLNSSGYVACVPIVTASHDWGILAFGHADVQKTIADINSLYIWASILGSSLEHEALESTLDAEREVLRGAVDRENALSKTILELGCPLIPLLPGVLLIPLIGSINTERAQQITETVLNGINEQQASRVLLDITGVSMVDTHVASSLMQIARAAMLLGAKVALVGVRPDIAQSIVSLGINLNTLITYPNLRTAIQQMAMV